MATYNPQFVEIGTAFVRHFYSMFDVPDAAARNQSLSGLYDPDNSFLSFEGAQVKGRQAILEKFGSLPFRSIQHATTTVDCQPLADGSIVVVVIGQLKVDEDPVQSFSHTFLLKPAGGAFFIANELFRLVLHNAAG